MDAQIARRNYIDWARGIAVLLMIEAHTTDAWTRANAKQTVAFGFLVVLGGFAAPLFLWLAGVGVTLAASRTAARTGSRARAMDAACRRGLEIFLLAFLFRLQAFVLSPGGPAIKLFRVDILNVMGPAMVLAGVLWIVADSPRWRATVYALAAALIAMTTPLVRAAPAVARLPVWFQWYVRPAGEYTTFTLFPWAGFVFAGAAVGALVAAVRGSDIERRLHVGFTIAGALLIVGGFLLATRPSIYSNAWFWTTSPTWFAIRVGILMLVLTVCFGVEQIESSWRPLRSWQHPLAKIGRSSLFIYWIHVELVYGYASWLWRGRLPLWGTVAGYAAFCVLMYGAVILRDRLVETWRRIGPGPQSTIRNAQSAIRNV